MKIMTWNIQDGGVRNRSKPDMANLQSILSIIKNENPDIIAIQEFKYMYWNELAEGENGLKNIGFKHFFFDKVLTEYKGRYGVIICSKLIGNMVVDKPKDICKYSYRNWCEVRFSQPMLRILTVDVPLNQNYNGKIDSRERKKFLEKGLKPIFFEYQGLSTPAIVLGDFNLCIKKYGYKSSFSEYLKLFEEKMNNLVKGISFGKQQNDYIFGNDSFTKLVKPKYKEPISQNCSDHNYLIVEIDNIRK